MTATEECPAGYYCPSKEYFTARGLTYGKIPCPRGTYRAAGGAAESDDCVACDAGSYCDTEAMTAVTAACDAGYFCREGATEPNPAATDTDWTPPDTPRYGPCPAGHYCSAGASAATPCPAGTFGSQEGAVDDSACQTCSEGSYCGSAGLAEPEGKCLPGYRCPAGSLYETGDELIVGATPATECPIGTYCPQSATWA